MEIHLKTSKPESLARWSTGSRTVEGKRPEKQGVDLLESFEQIVDARDEEVAIYLRDPRVVDTEPRYLALSFSELKLERDAWSHRLRALGVGPEDRVLLWLPQGLTLVAATYALLRMGAEVALADESISWGGDMEAFAPTVVLASMEVVSACRRQVDDSCQVLEVRSSLLRVAAGVRSSRPRRTASRRMISGIVIFREGPDGVRRAIRFGESAISSMLAVYRERMRIHKYDTDAPVDCLMSILSPALGATCVFTEAGFGARDSDRVEKLVGAIEDLGLSRLARPFSVWNEVLDFCGKNSIVCRGVNNVFVSDDAGQSEELLGRFREWFPNAEVFSTFGSQAAPVVAVRHLNAKEGAIERSGVGYLAGQPLGGLRWQILSKSVLGEPSVDAFDGTVGELHLAGTIQGSILGERSRYLKTGYYARVGENGDLWVCGRVDEVVRTSWGCFLPSQCEPVFERHRKVSRVVLLGLTTKKSTRLGILVQVEPGCLPKGALAEAKLKAELLQLGAQCEKTKLILEMFFVEHIPNRGTENGALDRSALSRRYSVLARLKSLF